MNIELGPSEAERVYQIAFGWSYYAFLTCPVCKGLGTTKPSNVVCECGPCAGTGLLHPRRAEEIRRRLNEKEKGHA